MEKILILCGGKGKRMGVLGEAVPKVLVKLDGESVLKHKIKGLVKQGYKKFILALGYKSEIVKEECKKINAIWEYEISNSGVEASMLKRICDAAPLFSSKVIVTYGDSVSNLQISNLVDYHNKKKSLVTIVTAPIQSPFGLVSTNENGLVNSFEEKPVLKYYVGTCVIEKKALDMVDSLLLKKKDGAGLIEFFKIIMSSGNLYSYEHNGIDLTFNTVEELDEAEKGFLKFYTHFNKST